MKDQYASMPKWMMILLGIKPEMDVTCFRMHDHDYGNAGYVCCGWKRAETRLEADEELRNRLMLMGLSTFSAYVVYFGCRLFCANKWRTNGGKL